MPNALKLNLEINRLKSFEYFFNTKLSKIVFNDTLMDITKDRTQYLKNIPNVKQASCFMEEKFNIYLERCRREFYNTIQELPEVLKWVESFLAKNDLGLSYFK